MVTVRKGNVLQNISEEMVQDYVRRGYDICNKGGVVIEKSIPTDIAALQKAYTDQQARIAALEKQIAENAEDEGLKAMYQELEKGHEELLTTYETVEEENETLKTTNAALTAQITELEKKISELEANGEKKSKK